MSLFGLRGVHVPHFKNTASMKAVRMPIPKTVVIPMSMHIGAPATPIVKVGDLVQVGQVIGETSGYVSSPVHASVSGKVTKVDELINFNGSKMTAIVIESDGEMTPYTGITKPEVTNYEQFVAAVRNSGIVGLGGAGFPTEVKLSVKDTSRIEEIILNGAECEPFITSDTRTMLDRSEDIFEGIQLLKTYLKVPKVIIGIEDNKPEAIKAMQEIAKKDPIIEVCPLKAVYPQGGEKVLIYNTTKKVVPQGKLPIDVGCVVLNVTTCAFLAQYMRTGMPLVEKCITVDGSAVAEPKNVIVPIGTPMRDVFDFCGGFKSEPKRVLYGGPMMGVAVPDLDRPVLKTTNALIAFNEKDANRPQETNCIRCGNCVNHCPMRLDVVAIGKAYEAKDYEALKTLKVDLCMECGCCSYICPAKRNIVSRQKLAKAALQLYNKQQAEKEAK